MRKIPVIASSTATLGSDYGNILPSSQQLIIPAGFSYTEFTVSVMGDSTIEANETVEFVLGAPTNAGLANASQGPTRFVFNIGDNDTPTVLGNPMKRLALQLFGMGYQFKPCNPGQGPF